MFTNFESQPPDLGRYPAAENTNAGQARLASAGSAAQLTLPRLRKAAVCIKFSGIVGRKPRKAENWRTGAHYPSSQAWRHSGPAGGTSYNLP